MPPIPSKLQDNALCPPCPPNGIFDKPCPTCPRKGDLIWQPSIIQRLSKLISTNTDYNFGFIFKYGVGARNELNTFEGTFKKDMVTKDPVTTSLELTNKELNTILNKMTEIDFFNLPEEITGCSTIPCVTYQYSVRYKDKNKKIYMENHPNSQDAQILKLKELNKLIIEIIESKEEYRQLPPAKGGYL